MTVDTPETMDEKALLDDFKGRYTKLRDENQQLVAKVKDNETQMLKLQGAIETLEYYGVEGTAPPTEVDNVDIPGDDVTDGSPELTN